MICARRRTDTVLIEVDWPPRLRVLPEAAHFLVQPLSRIEDAQLCSTQRVRNSEKDRLTLREESILI